MPEDRHHHLATRDHAIGNSSRPARRPPFKPHARATQLRQGSQRRRERARPRHTVTSFVAYSSQEDEPAPGSVSPRKRRIDPARCRPSIATSNESVPASCASLASRNAASFTIT